MVSAGATAVAADVNYIANVDIFNGIGTCSLATTSASYVDITSASKSFVKLGSSTASDLIVAPISLSAFVTTATTVVKIGVRVSGVDYDVAQMLVNTANDHRPMPTGGVRITGLAAGTYTVQLRALRVSGAGTITIDANDTVSFIMRERAL